jgi:hypothetical protein
MHNMPQRTLPRVGCPYQPPWVQSGFRAILFPKPHAELRTAGYGAELSAGLAKLTNLGKPL